MPYCYLYLYKLLKKINQMIIISCKNRDKAGNSMTSIDWLRTKWQLYRFKFTYFTTLTVNSVTHFNLVRVFIKIFVRGKVKKILDFGIGKVSLWNLRGFIIQNWGGGFTWFQNVCAAKPSHFITNFKELRALPTSNFAH